MASTEQLRANKANAQKSTGPRTQAGKQRSRLNARQHGLTAKLLVIGDEDPADFDELRASLSCLDRHVACLDRPDVPPGS